MPEFDYLQRFLFEHHAVRGELVFLRDVFQTVTQQRQYPAVVKHLLGQAMTATALLGATIKYKGRLILQAQTAGPVNLLVVQCDESFNMRALARWQDDSDFSGQLFGEGHMIMTVAPDNTTERYQGVIDLSSDQLSENLERYFEQSEQLPTKLWLAAGEDQTVGLLIQKMPDLHSGELSAGEEWDYWEHVITLAGTITEKELLTLDIQTILYRLFHEEDVRLYESQPIRFRCDCSKDKMTQAVLTMGQDEIADILRTYGMVEVTCDFCNNTYAFSKPEIDIIFIPLQDAKHPSRHSGS
ncbi:MAG: Hsp33 family molecular chaperone HslO [Gammaproteobacteria bacterium]